MAYIKLYTYEEGNTLNTTLLSSEKIYIDEVSVPEISMSSMSYFFYLYYFSVTLYIVLYYYNKIHSLLHIHF